MDGPLGKIHSLHFIKFDLTIQSQQAWLAQWQSAGLVSQRSQVQILLMTIFFFFGGYISNTYLLNLSKLY